MKQKINANVNISDDVDQEIYSKKNEQVENNEDLMMRVQNGDQKAFEQLYGRYIKAIYNFSLNYIGHRDLAEELAHETFLKVYRAKDQYKTDYKFTTWLWRIARNTCIDFVRKKDPLKHSQSSHVFKEGEEVYLVEEMRDPNFTDAETQLIEHSEKQLVKHCLGAIEGNQKEAIMLRIFSDLSYTEISDTLNLSMASVKGLLNRAKKSLLKCLEKKRKEDGYEG